MHATWAYAQRCPKTWPHVPEERDGALCSYGVRARDNYMSRCGRIVRGGRVGGILIDRYPTWSCAPEEREGTIQLSVHATIPVSSRDLTFLPAMTTQKHVKRQSKPIIGWLQKKFGGSVRAVREPVRGSQSTFSESVLANIILNDDDTSHIGQ